MSSGRNGSKPNSPRNASILESVRLGDVPVLQFEIDILGGRFEKLVASQHENGVLLHEAMTQGAETFHDNSPAEAITEISHRLTKQANRLARIVDKTILYSYPDEDFEQITVGSVVVFASKKEPETERRVLLTGVTSDRYSSFILGARATMMSLTSPAGKAIFDQQEGGGVNYRVGHTTHELAIVSISQLATEEGLHYMQAETEV